MTINDAIAILKAIDTVYPQQAADDETLKMRAAIWANIFRDYPADTVKRAAIAAIADSKFAPTPAEVMEHIPKGEQPSFEALWQELLTAVRKADVLADRRRYPLVIGVADNGKPIYQDWAKEQANLWAELPPVLQAYLGSFSSLADMAMYSDRELDFRRTEIKAFCEAWYDNQAKQAQIEPKRRMEIGG